jgi:hypothetical protein
MLLDVIKLKNYQTSLNEEEQSKISSLAYINSDIIKKIEKFELIPTEREEKFMFMIIISYEYKETMTELQFAFKDESSCDKFIYTVRCMVNNNQK